MTDNPESRKRIVAKRASEKGKNPKFRRQESWRYKRIKENWRRPGGVDSKMRKKVKGWPLSPGIGYRGPVISRGFHPSGFREVRVFNVDDLTKIDAKTQAIRVAHTVGAKKKIEIINRAKEMGIHILNLRKPAELEETEAEKSESRKSESKKP